MPATIEKVGLVLCVAGGVGTAELLPVARAFRQAGNHVVALCGARSTAHIILDQEPARRGGRGPLATDDGSGFFHGNVVELMRAWKRESGATPAPRTVIGPIFP